MVVPGSYRGCDTCRRWKKKCNKEIPCTLCEQLAVPCIGVGVQRFRFRDETLKYVTSNSSQIRTVVARTPSNEATQLNARLLHLFETPDRGRNSCWMLPRAILETTGTSAVLDKSLTAVLSVLESLQPPLYRPNVRALMKYASAVKAVRKSVSDCNLRYDKDTMIAVYYLTICEPWMFRSGETTSHSVSCFTGHLDALSAMAGVLSRDTTNMNDAGRAILRKVALQLLLEVPYNSDKDLPRWVWETLKVVSPEALTPPARRTPRFEDPSHLWQYEFYCFNLSEFVLVPGIMRHPRANMLLIKHLYGNLRDAYSLCMEYCERTNLPVQKGSVNRDIRRLSIHGEARCGLIYYGILFNCFLRTNNPDDRLLAQDRAIFCGDAIRVAEEIKQEIPISALDAPAALISAWCVAEDGAVKNSLRGLIEDYRYSWGMAHFLSCVPNWKEAPKKLSREIPWIPSYKYGKQEWPDDYDLEMWQYCSVM